MSGTSGGAGGAGRTEQGSVPGDSPSAGRPGHQGQPGSGGTTMTSSAQPVEQPHHPPQAYPAPGASGGHGPGAQRSGHEPEPGADAESATRMPRTGARTVPRTRKARLRVAKADPWSVMKVSFLLSIALGICTIVAVAVLWMVMDAMGVFSTIGDTISDATASPDGGGFDLESVLSLPRVLLFTSVIAAIDVVLATALATLGAFIYNLSAGFVGGVELTLAEDE